MEYRGIPLAPPMLAATMGFIEAGVLLARRAAPIPCLIYLFIYAFNSDQIRPCLDASQNLKLLQDFPSHRIFRHMHGVLNIDKK